MRIMAFLFIIALFIVPLGACQRGQNQAGKQQTSETAAQGSAAVYSRAEEAYLAGRHDEALDLLKQIPAGSPESARAHNLMGLIQARRGNMALASLEFQEAVRADPNFAQAHNNLGMIYLQEGRLELAQASFQSAVRDDPYYVAPHQGLAEAYYKMGKMEDARSELKVAEELRSTQTARANAALMDLEIGQRLDVARLVEQEQQQPRQTASRPTPRPRATKPAPKQAESEAPTVTSRVVAPTGTTITIAVDQAISSATAQVGQEVTAHVVGDVTVGRDTVIRNGAAVKGKVTQAESSGRVKGRATLALGFNSVETSAGWRDIEAHMVEGTLKAPGTKKRDAATVGIGAAAGAVLGEIIGDKAGLGAVIGGAAGTAVVLSTKGKEVQVEPGTQLGLELDQPLAITVTKTAPVTE